MSSDVDALAGQVERLKLDVRMALAAIKIQRSFRDYLVAAGERKRLVKESAAALKLQRQWKVHRLRALRDRLAGHKVHQAAALLQRYVKGYVVAKQYEAFWVQVRLYNNLKFFDNMSLELRREAAQIQIARVWRRHRGTRKRKRKRRATVDAGCHHASSRLKPHVAGNEKAALGASSKTGSFSKMRRDQDSDQKGAAGKATSGNSKALGNTQRGPAR